MLHMPDARYKPRFCLVVSSAWQPSLLEDQPSRPSFIGSFEWSHTSTRRLAEVTSTLIPDCLLFTDDCSGHIAAPRLQREVHSEPSAFLRGGFFLLASLFAQTESLSILDPSLLPFKLFGNISTVNNPERRGAGLHRFCVSSFA
jgi:hypothetical protein